MLNSITIQEILNQPESSTLDFKRELYDFAGAIDRANASLVKDVCAMVNTVRSQTSYIIFGVDAPAGRPVSVIGINSFIDDGIIQDKVKQKISPRPEFKYYTVQTGMVVLGVMEFPVRRYELPVTPVVNVSNVKMGTTFYRQGSTNTEATGSETIRIYEWLRSLPPPHTLEGKHEELTNLLQQLQQTQSAFSPLLPKMLAIGRKYNIQNITDFSLFELDGVNGETVENSDVYKYRLQKVFIDIGGNITINNSGATAAQVRDAIISEDHFIQSDLHMGQSVQQMEAWIHDMSKNSDMRFGVIKSTTKGMMPWYRGNDTLVHVYLFSDDLTNTVRRIRQKAINLVLDELR